MAAPFGVIRRSPMILVAFGFFLMIIGGAFIGAGFLAGTETRTFKQQVSQYNKAVSIYEEQGEGGENDKKKMHSAASTSSAHSVDNKFKKRVFRRSIASQSPEPFVSLAGQHQHAVGATGRSIRIAKANRQSKHNNKNNNKSLFAQGQREKVEKGNTFHSAAKEYERQRLLAIAAAAGPFSSSAPTRKMIRELLPFQINRNPWPFVDNTTSSPLDIFGETQGAAYPFMSSVIQGETLIPYRYYHSIPQNNDNHRNDMLNEERGGRNDEVSERSALRVVRVDEYGVENETTAVIHFDFPKVTTTVMYHSPHDGRYQENEESDEEEEVEVSIVNFTRRVILKKRTSSPALCHEDACTSSFFVDYCKHLYGNESTTYRGTGCSRDQPSCGTCEYVGYLRSYCVPMTYTLTNGPSDLNSSKIVKKKVWAPAAEPSTLSVQQSSSGVDLYDNENVFKSCYFPFGENDQEYGLPRQKVKTPKIAAAALGEEKKKSLTPANDNNNDNNLNVDAIRVGSQDSGEGRVRVVVENGEPEQLSVVFTLRLVTDPFIELERLTKGTHIFSHTQPQKEKMFGNREPNEAALIITGCVMGSVGVLTALVGAILWIQRHRRRQIRNPLRYSIIATSEADGGVATVIAHPAGAGNDETGSERGSVAGGRRSLRGSRDNSSTSIYIKFGSGSQQDAMAINNSSTGAFSTGGGGGGGSNKTSRDPLLGPKTANNKNNNGGGGGGGYGGTDSNYASESDITSLLTQRKGGGGGSPKTPAEDPSLPK